MILLMSPSPRFAFNSKFPGGRKFESASFHLCNVECEAHSHPSVEDPSKTVKRKRKREKEKEKESNSTKLLSLEHNLYGLDSTRSFVRSLLTALVISAVHVCSLELCCSFTGPRERKSASRHDDHEHQHQRGSCEQQEEQQEQKQGEERGKRGGQRSRW